MQIHYHLTTNIHLSLENYHNAGLTPEETKAAIERIQSPNSALNLYCTPQGINSNWNVCVYSRNLEVIDEVVWQIKYALDCALEDKNRLTAGA
jgi:hypothetical protein